MGSDVPPQDHLPALKAIMMFIQRFAAAAVLGLAALGARAAGYLPPQPAHDFPQAVVTADQARSCVLAAAQQRHWRLVEDKDGRILLAYPGTGPRAEKHQVVVRVDYDAKSFKLSYVSSFGLDEDRACRQAKDTPDETDLCIHRRVPAWFANLTNDILSAAQYVGK